MEDNDRTASLMTPAKLAQVRPKATVSPAQWLDQMASDAGHQHVTRLGQLRAQLESLASQRDVSPLAAELDAVAAALPRLDFGLLKPQGLLARFAGRSRSSGGEFMTQYQQAEDALAGLGSQVATLQARQGEQARGTDMALLELEVEYRALGKIIEQGAKWLHDMRNQLKAREGAGPDDAQRQEIREQAARCEILVARLKALRALSTAAQETHQGAREAAARRAGLLQTLQQALASDVRLWRGRVSSLASAAAEGRASAGVEDAMEAHRDLQLCIKQVVADCVQLRAQEKSLSEGLAQMGPHLQAAASA